MEEKKVPWKRKKFHGREKKFHGREKSSMEEGKFLGETEY